jgi:hypothetical protein
VWAVVALAVAAAVAVEDRAAGAWPRLRRNAEPAEQVEPVKLDVERMKGRLFPKELPVDVGAPPAGLANGSAQGCAACHPQVADRWASGPHAVGPTEALLEAARGRPACLSCHLPLASQHDTLYAYEGGHLDRPVPQQNTAFQATLAIEGVTCAACHVRDGAVVVPTEAAAAAAAPHPMVFAERLATSEACAACHQLAWPGADQPLYDTFGEWERSGFAQMGITCQGCHMLGAADGSLGADHRVAVDAGRALSVLLEAPKLSVVRGGAPVAARLTLQNTGAGHAFPTGSPFRGAQVEVALVRTPSAATLEDPLSLEPLRLEQLSVELSRRVAPEPPFALEADTRLQAGESRSYDLSLALPQEAPPGRWRLVVTVARTVRGAPTEPALVERSWALEVE